MKYTSDNKDDIAGRSIDFFTFQVLNCLHHCISLRFLMPAFKKSYCAVQVNQLELLLSFKWLCWESDDSLNWIYWEPDHSLKLDISRTRRGDDSLNWIYWMQWMRNCTFTPRQQQKLILSVLMFYTAKAGDSLNWIYWKQQIQKWTLILLSTIEIQSLLINSALSTA